MFMQFRKSSYLSLRRAIALGLMGALIFMMTVVSVNAGSILVSSPHYLGYGYGDSSWDNFSNALDVATGNHVSVAPDFSNLSQMLNYDALLLPPRQTGDTLNSTELNNLSSFIATGRRVILMGENSAWTSWNNQILGLVGGTFAGEYTGTANAVLSDPLTSAAATIYLPACGIAVGGTALYDHNVATLWNPNKNVLTMLNINVWDDTYGAQYNNNQFAINAANWLAAPVPEPSILGMLCMSAIGLLLFAWKRRNQ
jgi:hypothetical protein